MRACVQRVSSASVVVDDQTVGEIDHGLVVLLGVEDGDTSADMCYLCDKIVQLRIFGDDEGKMNRSVLDEQGGLLVISQFTLLGDCRKGRRPSFVRAAAPEIANQLYEEFVRRARELGAHVETGVFQAMMAVQLVNDGPVTMLLDSKKTF